MAAYYPSKPSKAPARKPHRWGWGLLLVAGLGIGGFAVFISQFDINRYRPALEGAFADQTGRTLQLNGPITWDFSLTQGLSLSISDIVLSNPSWASRPDMARIGKANLHVEALPLLEKKLNIVAFDLEKADIQLESSATGAVNWLFQPQVKPPSTAPSAQEKKVKEQKDAISIDIRKVAIADSRFGFKNKEGKLSVFDAPELTYQSDGKEAHLHYKGTVSDVPTEIDIAGSPLVSITTEKWPFNAKIFYGDLEINAKGQVQDQMKKVVLDTYRLASGESTMEGQMTIDLTGTRPFFKGSLNSPHFDPADFAVEEEGSPAKPDAKQATKETAKTERFFSDKPLPLEGLTKADMAFDIKIDEMVLGLTSLQEVTAKAELKSGYLSLSPISAQVAGSTAQSQVTLNAASSMPELAFTLKAADMDISKLAGISGIESFLNGKSSVDIQIKTMGRSPHDFASYANGSINLLMDKGTLSSSMMKDIAGSLLSIFAPGVGGMGDPSVNCMAARFILTQGLMETKGLLLDTGVTTVAGSGYANLADERMNMSLRTKPKTLGLGNVLPSMSIRGSLASPIFTMDTKDAVQKVAGLLTGEEIGTDVPTLVQTDGQNACAATLDSPPSTTKAPAPSAKDVGSVLLPGTASGIGKVNDMLKSIGKGLFQ